MSADQTSVSSISRVLLFTASSVLLASCGGSGGGDDSANETNAASSLVPPGGSSIPADDLTTRQIQEIAAASMMNMLDLGSGETMSQFDLDLSMGTGSGADSENVLSQNMSSSNLDASLGLNENEVDSITREGNLVTIDLNENEICAQDAMNPNEVNPDQINQAASDLELCLSLMQQATVTIDAISDDSGVVAYLYRDEALVRVGYAPNAGSLEFRLDPLLTIAIDQQAFLFEPGEEIPPFPTSFSGAYRLSAEADAEFPDEIGRIALDLTEALNINIPSENVSITGEPSTLWAAGMTPTGGSIEFNISEYRIDAPWENGLNQTASLAMPGFSGRADVRESDGLLSVSNFGMSNGPLSINIGSGDSILLVLEKFGFTVSEANNEVVLTGDLNLNVLLDNTLGTLVDESEIMDAVLESLAPAGSTFLFTNDGPIQLLSGGPFSVLYNVSDGETNEGSSVVVDAGGCFDSASDDVDDANLIQLVACEN